MVDLLAIAAAERAHWISMAVASRAERDDDCADACDSLASSLTRDIGALTGIACAVHDAGEAV